jgi:vitamin B12 transporter
MCRLRPLCFACFAVVLAARADEARVEVRASRLSPANETSPDSRNFDEGRIRASGLKTLGDFLALEASFQGALKPGASSLSLRGLPDGNVLVVWNGLVLNDPLHTVSGYDFSRLSLEGVHSLRLIRGPEAGLWGSGAGGAVVLVESRLLGEVPPGRSMRLKASLASPWGMGASAWGVSNSAERSIEGFVGHRRAAGPSQAAASDGNSEDDAHHGSDAFVLYRERLSRNWSLLSLALVEDSRVETDARGGPGGDARDFETRSGGLRGGLRASYAPPSSSWTHDFSYESSWDNRDNDRPPQYDVYRSRRQGIAYEARVRLSERDALSGRIESRLEDALSRELGEDARFSRKTVDARLRYERRGRAFSFASGLATQKAFDENGIPWAFFVAPSWSFATSGTRVTPSLGHSFKRPSLYQRYSPYGDPDLEAEESRSVQLSVLQDLPFAASEIEATLFDIASKQSLDFDLAGWVGKRRDLDAVTFAEKDLDPYLLWSLNLAKDWAGAWRSYLRVDNLLDRSYEEIDGYGTPGRNIEVGIEISF